MSFLKNTPLGDMPRVCNWEYDDAAAREAATGLENLDIGKFARQLDDNSVWMLAATDPVWVQVGASGGVLDGYAFASDVDALEVAMGHVIAVQDGYALAATENQRWVDSTEQRQALRDAADGYGVDLAELDTAVGHILTAADGYLVTSDISGIGHNATAINDILGSLDGYADWDSSRVVQIEGAIQTILGDLDGYLVDSDISGISHNATAINDILGSLDGYADWDSSRVVQIEDAIQTILGDLDGYLVNSDISGISHNATAINDILGSLDGYADWDESRVTQIEGAIQTVLGDLDGYLVSSDVSGISHNATAINDILNSLDGYADWNDSRIAQIEEAQQIIIGELDGYDQATAVLDLETAMGFVIPSLDGYSGSATVDTLEQQVTWIQEACDGYGAGGDTSVLEQQVTWIQESLDGYGAPPDLTDIENQVTDIQNSLDGYSDWDESRVTHIEGAIQTILGDLDGYGAGGGDTSALEQQVTWIQEACDGYGAGGGDTSALEAQVTDIQNSLDGYDAYGDGFSYYEKILNIDLMGGEPDNTGASDPQRSNYGINASWKIPNFSGSTDWASVSTPYTIIPDEVYQPAGAKLVIVIKPNADVSTNVYFRNNFYIRYTDGAASGGAVVDDYETVTLSGDNQPTAYEFDFDLSSVDIAKGYGFYGRILWYRGHANDTCTNDIHWCAAYVKYTAKVPK